MLHVARKVGRYYGDEIPRGNSVPCVRAVMRCPLCVNETYVWKFGMQHQYHKVHKQTLKHDEMPKEFRISSKEWRAPTGDQYNPKDLL